MQTSRLHCFVRAGCPLNDTAMDGCVTSPNAQQSIHRHQRLELQKLAERFLWRYAAKTMAPLLRGTVHLNRSEQHVLSTPAAKHVRKVAGRNAGRISVRNQRTSL